MSKKFNIFDQEDDTFPAFGLETILENAADGKGKAPVKKDSNDHTPAEVLIIESANATSAMAMSAALAWIEGEDYSYQALSEYAAGIADLDGDEEFSDEEIALYNDILTDVADSFLSFGADPKNVDDFLNGEDDAAGAKLGAFVSEVLNGESASNDEMVAAFAGGESVMESGVLEAAFKKMKVVRGGKVKIVKKRVGKVHLSSAQKAGLKKARRKAFTGIARMHRAKSMKLRHKRGM